MKMKKNKPMFLILVAIISISCTRPNVNDQEKGLAGFLKWPVTKDGKLSELICKAAILNNGEYSITKFTISDDQGNILHEREDATLTSLMITGDVDGHLLAIWQGGSAFRFYVYGFDGKRISLLLESGSKVMPELVHSSDGEYQIIVTDTYQKPWVANKYIWNGTAYKSRAMSYQDRLK